LTAPARPSSARPNVHDGAVRVENSLRLIHFGTIVLLFSMIAVVAYLHLAGFFDWVTELSGYAAETTSSSAHSHFPERVAFRASSSTTSSVWSWFRSC